MKKTHKEIINSLRESLRESLCESLPKSEKSIGYIYVLSNPCMWYKYINICEQNPLIIARALYTSGLCEPFEFELAKKIDMSCANDIYSKFCNHFNTNMVEDSPNFFNELSMRELRNYFGTEINGEWYIPSVHELDAYKNSCKLCDDSDSDSENNLVS